VLAISNEAPTTVWKFLDREGYTVRTASGSRSGGVYGVSGIPASFLVDPQGKIVWKGSPRELTRQRVERALQGAHRPSGREFLALRTAPGAHMQPALAAAVAAAEAGRLGEALEEARRVASAESTEPAARAVAGALAVAVERHVELLVGQAEGNVARRDVLPAVRVLEGLAESLEGRPEGRAAKEKLAELRRQETFTAEFAAARALEEAVRSQEGEQASAVRARWKAIADEFPGTRAAERAQRRLARS